MLSVHESSLSTCLILMCRGMSACTEDHEHVLELKLASGSCMWMVPYCSFCFKLIFAYQHGMIYVSMYLHNGSIHHLNQPSITCKLSPTLPDIVKAT